MGDRWTMHQERPERFGYLLTEKDWGFTPRSSCGHLTVPTLTCSECGEEFDPRAVRPEPGPRATLSTPR